MTNETGFFVLFAVFAVVAMVYTYLYFVTVLPTLRSAGRPSYPEFLPSRQLAQARECASLLSSQGRPGARYWALRALPFMTWGLFLIGLCGATRGCWAD